MPCCLVDVSVFRTNLPPPSSATNTINRWCRQEENCVLLGYYAASSGNLRHLGVQYPVINQLRPVFKTRNSNLLGSQFRRHDSRLPPRSR